MAGALSDRLRGGAAVEGGRDAAARGPAPARSLSAPTVGRRLEAPAHREGPVRGPGHRRGGGRAHRPAPRRRRDLVRVVRRGRPDRDGRLQLRVLPDQVHPADPSVPDVRATRPGGSRELALPSRPGGSRRRDRGPRPRALAMAGRPRRLDVLGADGAADQWRGARGQPARQRPLQLPVEHRVRGAGRRGRARSAPPPKARSRDHDDRLGGRGGRGAEHPDAGSGLLDPDPGLVRFGDALAMGGGDGPGVLPLPREPGLRDHQRRARPGASGRSRGTPASGDRAATRQSHSPLQPGHPPAGPDAIRRSGSGTAAVPRAPAGITERVGTARASLPAPRPPR